MFAQLRAFLCCQQDNVVHPSRITPSKPNKDRVDSEFKPEQITVIRDEIRRAGLIQAHCCPICFLYYSKILKCNQCSNYICRFCIDLLIQKADSNKQQLKCSFCSSKDAMFIDKPPEDKKVYFDASIPVFPPKMQYDEAISANHSLLAFRSRQLQYEEARENTV